MSEQQIPHTLQDAMDYAARMGVALTKSDYTRLRQIEETALIEVLPPENRFQGLIDNFNHIYADVLRFIIGIGEVVVTFVQTTSVSFGLPAVLVLLLIVEHSRVKLGIALFESHDHLANMGSWALVITNTVLEFTIYYIEYKHGYHAQRAVKGSLRLTLQNLTYRLGIGYIPLLGGQEWKAQELSPAARIKGLQTLLTLALLILATAGSMRDVIAQEPGKWHEALVNILTDSGLSNMSIWASGLLFALTAVVSAQVVTSYMAIYAREIQDKQGRQHGMIRSEQIERMKVQYILATVTNKSGSAENAGKVTLQDNGEPSDFLAPLLTLATRNGKNGHR